MNKSAVAKAATNNATKTAVFNLFILFGPAVESIEGIKGAEDLLVDLFIDLLVDLFVDVLAVENRRQSPLLNSRFSGLCRKASAAFSEETKNTGGRFRTSHRSHLKRLSPRVLLIKMNKFENS
jgi:hypothetical protein